MILSPKESIGAAISTSAAPHSEDDEFGIVVRAKARLVARGLGQREGIDFFDTFWRIVQ